MILRFLKKHFPDVKYPVKYIIRHNALGDVLWVEPLIKKLLERSSRIVVISNYSVLFENYPLPNVSFKSKLNVFEKLLYFFDRLLRFNILFINLNGSYERFPKMHLLLAYYLTSKVNDKIVYPKLYFSKAELYMPRAAAGKYVVLHLEKYPPDNNYRNVYGINWENIIRFLQLKGYTVIQVGNRINSIQGATFTETTIRELAVLIKNAVFFIGADSGPSQIAAALETPALIFFGSVNPNYRHRMDIFKGAVIQEPCEYAGCFHERYNRVRRTCILFGHEGIPKCSLHTDEIVECAINDLILKYNL